MGRLTVKGVAAELRKYYGVQANVARAFGVSRSAVSQYIAKHPELQAVCDECDETMLDLGDTALYASVIAKDPWAVKFLLATKGKKRGYVERNEITGKDGETFTVKVLRGVSMDDL